MSNTDIKFNNQGSVEAMLCMHFQFMIWLLDQGHLFNSMAPGGCESNLKSVISKHMLWINS